MKVFHDIESYQKWRTAIAQGERVGFVPTMGALHEGHARLLEVSKSENTHTVLSIFVNPTQFGPNEDLSKYPRTLESDLKIAETRGVSAVFVPNEQMLYPEGYSTYVMEEKLSQPLCGVFRPGHFRGVTTIVLKLFNITQPHHAYFGLKDAQQFFVIQKMVKDLNLSIQLTGVPTVRESTGLALSSRNVYLTEAERQKIAPRFYEVLSETKTNLASRTPISTVISDAKAKLKKFGFEVQYFELRSLPHLENLSLDPKPLEPGQSAVLAGALFLGQVRLIDNLIF
jgi:pantoate--beta-alanine ligase